MPLIRMSSLLQQARHGGYAVGSFSIINMETILGVIKAAEELRSPVILQIAEPRLIHMPLKRIGPAMVSAAKDAGVPVAVHFDHGKTREMIQLALDLGFSSVMIDASHLPFRQNVEQTKEIALLAHSRQADCEGEIGQLGLREDGSRTDGEILTDTEEAVSFAVETGADAMAIAIGNQHGLQSVPPKLHFHRISEIAERVNIPLVLHGGSGTKDEDFKQCIRNGISKINVATATLQRVLDGARTFLGTESSDYFAFHDGMIHSAYQCVCDHINIFGSAGKA